MNGNRYYTSVMQAFCLTLALQCITAASMVPMKNQSANQGPTHQQQKLQQHQQHSQNPQHQQQQPQQAQYVHEKEPSLQDGHSNSPDDDLNLNDPYQILNEYPNHESRLPAPPPYPWNPFGMPMPTTYHNAATTPPAPPQQQPQQMPTSAPPPPPSLPALMYPPFGHYSTHTPKFLPIIGYPQPVFIPFPLYIAPEMFYPAFSPSMDSPNDIEDMARAANGRRSSTPRNSPIYYVRLPPTPYMYLAAAQAAASTQASSAAPYGAGYGSLMSLPRFSPLSSIFNLPVNFLANGKPSNIYQMSSLNDIQNPLQFGNGFNGFGPPPRPNPYRPAVGNYMTTSQGAPFGLGSYQQQQQQQQQDTKMTSLKRPFIFNGRPEDIYVLPNNFNSIYSDAGYF